MNDKKAAASVILAGVLWGIINIFVKKLSAAGLGSLQIAFSRMAVASVGFTGFLALTAPGKLRIKPRDIWMFIGTGIVSIVFFNCAYFYTMTHGQASIAVVLLYTSPVFIMLLSRIIFKEKITALKLFALVLTLAGCVLVAGLIGGQASITPLIMLTGIASGLFYALYTIFGRFALARYDSFTVTAFTFIFGLIGSIPFADFNGFASALTAEPLLPLYILGLGIFSTILPYIFYTWGLQRMESGKAAILVAVEPLVGAVIGMTLFHEPHDPMKLAGIACILAAIVILNR